jgi:hypothetical protein
MCAQGTHTPRSERRRETDNSWRRQLLARSSLQARLRHACVVVSCVFVLHTQFGIAAAAAAAAAVAVCLKQFCAFLIHALLAPLLSYAGEATNTNLNPCVQGAMETSERAAKEIAAALQAETPPRSKL